MEQLNLDLTTEAIESRRHYQATTSFLVSLGVHLALLLTFSCYWIFGQRTESIRLQANAEQDVQLDNVDFEIELPIQEDPLVVEELQPPDFNFQDETPPISEFMEYSEPIDFGAELVDLDASATATHQPVTPSKAGSSGEYFFGIPPVGDRIVYIIDMSPSMQVGKYQRRFDRAVNEVLSAVDQLRADQKFFVILFSFKTVKLRLGPNDEFCFATEDNKVRLKKRLFSTELSSGTDPREALVAALKSEPSCIYLLSDGEFNGVELRNGIYRDKIDAFGLSLKHNKNKCPIHTIGLEDIRTQEQLSAISKASGGTYVFVPAED